MNAEESSRMTKKGSNVTEGEGERRVGGKPTAGDAPDCKREAQTPVHTPLQTTGKAELLLLGDSAPLVSNAASESPLPGAERERSGR